MAMEPPKAILWARIFAAALALMYVACILGGVLGIFGASQQHGDRAAQAMIQGVIMVVMGIGLSILCAIAFFRIDRRTKGTHTMYLVMMGLACTSCCCIPFALPLLLQWLKPEVKAWYGA
jgi:hypothetical protein